MEAHLVNCATCRECLRKLQALSATLKAYSIPEGAFSTDREFWRRLASSLPLHNIPGDATTAMKQWPFLAPLGLVLSSAVLKGLVILTTIAYVLYQWHVLPTSLLVASTSLAELLVGPMLWDLGWHLLRNLSRAISSGWPISGQVWYLMFHVLASGLLLLLSALYMGWLLYWLRGVNRINAYREAS